MQSELYGILPVEEGQFGQLQRSAVHWNNRLRQAVASCHSLTLVNKATVVGDEVEHSLFRAVEACFVVRLGCPCPCPVLCCLAMCCADLCHAAPRSVVWCNMFCCIVLGCATVQLAVLCCVVLCCTMPCRASLCCALQCCSCCPVSATVNWELVSKEGA